MMEDENKEVINIDWKCYKTYFGKYWRGLPFILLANFFVISY